MVRGGEYGEPGLEERKQKSKLGSYFKPSNERAWWEGESYDLGYILEVEPT